MKTQDRYISYGPGAYRGSKLPALAPASEVRAGFMDHPLKWGGYAGLDSAVEVHHQLEAEFQHTYERQDGEGRERKMFCDAQRWNFENVSRVPYFLFILKLMCFFFVPVVFMTDIATVYDSLLITFSAVLFVFLNVALFGEQKFYSYALMGLCALINAAAIAWEHNALWGYWSEQTAFWLGMILFMMALFGADALLWLYSRVYTHDGSGFDRRQGTLTIARRFRKPFVAPFYEFDAFAQLQLTPHGGHDYVLWLHHRYTGTKVCLATKLHSLGLDKQNLLAFWDTLQRYMDVEQPLPDLPILEQSRHLDPVTAAHDEANNRPPRRWRDTDAETWSREEGRQLREKLASYSWQQQSCILQERFDPSLSIERYYRQQEANGVQATPKAAGFDNIHRGGPAAAKQD